MYTQKASTQKSYLFQSSACFLFVEVFLTDLIFTGSIFTEYCSSIFSLALPKLPPNFLIRESGMIKPAMLSDCGKQMVCHGISIEITFALPVL